MTIWQDIKAGTIPARLTVEEVYAMTAAGALREGDHFELIGGEMVPMGAAKANWYSIWESRLNRMLVRALPDDLRLFCQASITFSADTLTEPDLAVWPKGIFPQAVRGPDLALLIEVADSSLPYDLRVKAPLYASFGVRDYWVVDAVRQTIRVHRAPMDSRYTDVDEFEAHQPVVALLAGVTVRLDQLD